MASQWRTEWSIFSIRNSWKNQLKLSVLRGIQYFFQFVSTFWRLIINRYWCICFLLSIYYIFACSFLNRSSTEITGSRNETVFQIRLECIRLPHNLVDYCRRFHFKYLAYILLHGDIQAIENFQAVQNKKTLSWYHWHSCLANSADKIRLYRYVGGVLLFRHYRHGTVCWIRHAWLLQVSWYLIRINVVNGSHIEAKFWCMWRREADKILRTNRIIYKKIW